MPRDGIGRRMIGEETERVMEQAMRGVEKESSR